MMIGSKNDMDAFQSGRTYSDTIDEERRVSFRKLFPTPVLEQGDVETFAVEAACIASDGYGFDYVMVFKAVESGVMSELTTQSIRQIIAAGFMVRVYFGASGHEVFCEMRAPMERLKEFADKVDRKMLLDQRDLQQVAEAGDPESSIAPIEINSDPEITFRSPYEFIYARYDRRPELQRLYHKNDGMSHPFRSTVRLSVVMDILKAPTRLGGAGLKPDKMKHNGEILGLFPKHYFGEKVGLYFQFLGHLTTWLIPLAVVGLVTALTVYITGNEEHFATLFFAPVVVFWAISEQTRPEYKGVFIRSPIDGRTVLYYPTGKKRWRARRATAIIVSMILVVVSCIGAVYAFRWYLVYGTTGDWGRKWGGIIASVINSVQIQILNAVYRMVAVALTDFENHRTATEYEDSLVAKLFSFTFCNSYGGFIYLAFIGEPVIGVACEYSCMSLLATNLTIVLVMQLVVGNLTEVLIPYAMYRHREAKETKENRTSSAIELNLRGDAGRPEGNKNSREKIDYTQAEQGFMLQQYDPIMGTLMDYAELAVQFGYITLFVVAFPLAPLLALVNNYVEMRSDAFKLLTQMQRPVPRGAEDIGCWQLVFTTITCVSVLTNSALICLIYEDLVGTYSLSTRLWIFILCQWTAFITIATLGAAVPDVPEDVKIQLLRTTFLENKIIDKVSDDGDEDTHELVDSDLTQIKVTITAARSPTGDRLFHDDDFEL